MTNNALPASLCTTKKNIEDAILKRNRNDISKIQKYINMKIY